MSDIRAGSHVACYYPEAISASYYLKVFFEFAQFHLHVPEERLAYLTSICSDDLNNVELPETRMVGPFVQGGLDGYPFAGITGLNAFSHHIPDDGAALMFYGPHVGITSSGEVGKVVRPGQKTPTACCGAAAAALKDLEEGKIAYKDPCDYPVDDHQQEAIRQFVLKHRAAIEGAGGPGDPRRFVAMSEAIYEEMKQAFLRQLDKTQFEHPAFFFGGILINQDCGGKSLVALRDAGQIENGSYRDMTQDFKSMSEGRFRAFEAGEPLH